MNTSIIRYVLGNILKLEGVILLLPCIIAGIYHERAGVYFLISACISVCVGFLLAVRKPRDYTLYLKEGCVATTLSWIVLSICGCLPYYLSGEVSSFTDSLFMAVSGFTTTGTSVLSDVEQLSYCMKFWCCFMNWIGGMGVLVFLLAIIPLSGGSNINLMRAESPGPSVGKLVPKLKHTARILYFIYIWLTFAEFVMLIIGHMNYFDAVCTALNTAGTGGFAIKSNSFAGYGVYHQWVVTIFMIMFGINFNAYYLIFIGHVKEFFKVEEMKHYLLIILVSVVIISLNIAHLCSNAFDAITKAAFQVASVITTTGYSTANYDTWPELSKQILLLLMFVGACAGSTSGGLKISRCVIAVKSIAKELLSYIHPKSVRKITFEHKPVDHDVIRSINVYFMAYILILMGSCVLLSIEDNDFGTTFSAAVSALNNVGMGFGSVGPNHSFAFFSNFSKYVLMFDMLAGRLELFPLLILFHPSVWRDLFIETDHKIRKKERRF